MFVNPSIRLELNIPAQKIISQYLENDEQFKKYINNSIDKAIKELLDADVFEKRIKLKLEDAFVSAFGSSVITNTIKDYILDYLKEHFNNILCKKDGCAQDAKE